MALVARRRVGLDRGPAVIALAFHLTLRPGSCKLAATNLPNDCWQCDRRQTAKNCSCRHQIPERP